MKDQIIVHYVENTGREVVILVQLWLKLGKMVVVLPHTMIGTIICIENMAMKSLAIGPRAAAPVSA